MGTLLNLTLIVVDKQLTFTAAVPGQDELINSFKTLSRVLLEAAGHHIKCLFAGSRRVSHLSGDPPRRDKAAEVLRSYKLRDKTLSIRTRHPDTNFSFFWLFFYNVEGTYPRFCTRDTRTRIRGQ